MSWPVVRPLLGRPSPAPIWPREPIALRQRKFQNAPARQNLVVRPVAVVLAALAGAALVAVSPAATKPSLAMAALQPPTVRGTHFARLERVRVGFSAGGVTATRTVRTTAAGTFVAPAPAGFAYSPCGSPLVVTAVGATGDRAALRLRQRECPSP
jgi:hypothetical protein